MYISWPDIIYTGQKPDKKNFVIHIVSNKKYYHFPQG